MSTREHTVKLALNENKIVEDNKIAERVSDAKRVHDERTAQNLQLLSNITPTQAAQHYETAVKSDFKKLTEKFKTEENYRKQTAIEIEDLISKIKALVSGKSKSELKEAFDVLVKQLENDEKLTIELNELMANNNSVGKWKDLLSIPLKSNKLAHRANKIENIIYGALQIITKHYKQWFIEESSDSDTSEVSSFEEVPEGYEYRSETPTVLGSKANIWGNSKGTYLKAALLAMYKSLAKIPDLSQMPGKNGEYWIDSTCLADGIPIPAELVEKIVGFNQTTFCSSGYKTGEPVVLVVPHSHYGFGSGRKEFSPAPINRIRGTLKQFGATDCTSEYDFPTTADINNRFRCLTEEFETLPEPVKIWSATSPDAERLSKYCILSQTGRSVSLANPSKLDNADRKEASDIKADLDFEVFRGIKEASKEIEISRAKPEDLHFKRTYILEYTNLQTGEVTLVDPQMKKDGVGGHLGMVVDLHNNGVVTTMSSARDMDKVEGLGLGNFSIKSEPYQYFIPRSKPDGHDFVQTRQDRNAFLRMQSE